jgi:hypothetical protein
LALQNLKLKRARQKVAGAFEAVINIMDGQGSCSVLDRDGNRNNVAKALLMALLMVELKVISGFLEFDRTKPSVTG